MGANVGPLVSSTCGRHGYSDYTCCRLASKHAPVESAGDARKAPRLLTPNVSIFPRVSQQVDGLEAGVEYLDTFEETSKETPLSKIRWKSLNRARKLMKQSRDAYRRKRKMVAKSPEQPATVDLNSIARPVTSTLISKILMHPQSSRIGQSHRRLKLTAICGRSNLIMKATTETAWVYQITLILHPPQPRAVD
jgi:hypothetical protein